MQNLASWLDRQIRTIVISLACLYTTTAGLFDPVSSRGFQAGTVTTVSAFIYIAIIGATDFAAANGLDFTFFYLIGCAFAGWIAGRRTAIFIAIAAGILSFCGDSRPDLVPFPGWIIFWNSAVNFMAFIVVSLLAAQVGRLTRGLEQTVQQRTSRLQSEIDEHKQTSNRLQEALQLFRQVTENITEVFWVTDASRSRFSYVSSEFDKVWGQPRKNVYVRPAIWLDAVHPEDRERIAQATRTRQVAGEYDEEFRIVRPDQSVRWVHERAFPVKNEQGEIYRIVGITEDITDRVRLERQILEISDREQARIGQDIHDGLCQKLISMAFDVNSLNESLSKQQGSELAISQRVSELLDETITESRRVARGLYPVRLETEGLLSALMELAQTTCERFKVRCSCAANAEEVLCDAIIATHLYRIAQEAVNNALKHSGATNISIRLDGSDNEIDLKIQDDGVGITGGSARHSGMGLCIMDYRARSLGGAIAHCPCRNERHRGVVPRSRKNQQLMASSSERTKDSRPVTGILLVDDHPMVRERLAEVINRESDLMVCAEAEDRHTDIEAIQKSAPGLAIVDLTLKDSSGLELIKDIHVRWPQLKILVVSMHDESLHAERVLRAGARGYITKQEATRNILLAIRRVLSGNIYLNEKTASTVIARLTSGSPAVTGSLSDRLTDRELQVFELTGSGLSTRDIAEKLHIEVKTVETYRGRIREKLDLQTSSELLQLAIRWNQNR
jgi:PAS domain S-box-containing protein